MSALEYFVVGFQSEDDDSTSFCFRMTVAKSIVNVLEVLLIIEFTIVCVHTDCMLPITTRIFVMPHAPVENTMNIIFPSFFGLQHLFGLFRSQKARILFF